MRRPTQGFNQQTSGVPHESHLSRQQVATSAATERTLQAASRTAQRRHQTMSHGERPRSDADVEPQVAEGPALQPLA